MSARDPKQPLSNPVRIVIMDSHIKKIERIFSICIATTFLTSCGDWPPHGEDLTKYVLERKTEIGRLISEFEADDFDRIDCPICLANKPVTEWDSVSYKFIAGQLHKVENSRSHDFAVMFREAGVMYISRRSNGELDLGIAAGASNKNRQYVVQLFHDPDRAYAGLKECVTEYKGIDCGTCKVTVDESLLIRYQWYPADIDPKLSKAGASGELDWDEWQAQRGELHDACMLEGMLKQGYERDGE